MVTPEDRSFKKFLSQFSYSSNIKDNNNKDNSTAIKTREKSASIIKQLKTRTSPYQKCKESIESIQIINATNTSANPDIIDFNLKVLFVGINPGKRSAQVGHHFAHHSNHFYPCLVESGFTNNEIINYKDDVTLPKRFNIGISNVVGRDTRSSADLSPAELRNGIPSIIRKVKLYKPKFLCFIGKCGFDAFEKVYRTPNIEKSKNFGARVKHYQKSEKLKYFIELKKLQVGFQEISGKQYNMTTHPIYQLFWLRTYMREDNIETISEEPETEREEFTPINTDLIMHPDKRPLAMQLYDSKTWYLMDGIAPADVEARTVVPASSKSIKDKSSSRIVNKFCMPPWSTEELEACRLNIFPDVPHDLMFDLNDEVGGVPRYVLKTPATIICQENPNTKNQLAIFNNRDVIKKRYLERVEEALKEISNFGKLIQCFSEDGQYVEFSSRLIYRWADTFYREQSLSWTSGRIFDKIQEKLEDSRWSNLFIKIKSPHDPFSSREIMLESYVLHLFKLGGQTFESRRLRENELKFCIIISNDN
ncbi:11127_t:CDS:2 [Diversispora eburnea]|uniref:11127_t:CDS:1 n=1 Tax=Diversispora eburnea TaxID=1213867 RepID=A0A9N8ZZJ2_9GLOM|nr:11127_t:CDS:2 [Diversispora eburnea]